MPESSGQPWSRSAWLERDQRAEPRARLDPDLARHTITELPWGETSTDALDGEARRVLDDDHTGLEDEDRILEYLAVRKLRRERGLADQGGRGAGAIIALVGPPGAWARPSASRWRGPWAASSSGPSAASATRPRSVATGAPTWAPSRAASPGRSRRPGP